MSKTATIVSCFLFLIYCQSPSTFSQEIKGSFSGVTLTGNFIFLWETLGSNAYLIDSARISSEGRFSFPAKNYPAGYYYLSLNDSSRADIILNPAEKEIALQFDNAKLQEGIKVAASEENKLLWQYKLISKSVYNDLKKIFIDKSYIPFPPATASDSSSLTFLQRQEDSLNSYKQEELKKLCESAPQTYFARSARPSLRKKYSNKAEEKKHFFETVDFTDSSLIRSNVFPMNIMDYLQRHTEYNEEGFRESVDTILSKAKANEAVFEFCLEYLLGLFDRVGPDIVFQYLAEKYLVGEGCSDIDPGSGFKEKAEAYKVLLPGNKAPEITVQDLSGKEKRISEIAAGSKVTLLFFWSSHCEFCHKVIPELMDLYGSYRQYGLEVIAISLDENKNEWEKFISENKLEWINLCDPRGWKSDAVLRYKIHKTPSFYLLDSQMNILSKPPGAELKSAIQKYLNR